MSVPHRKASVYHKHWRWSRIDNFVSFIGAVRYGAARRHARIWHW